MNKIRNYSIAIDAMGGDNSPKKIIDGCDIFLKENDNTNLIIFGDKSRIDNNFLEKYYKIVEFIHCDEVILDEDKPSSVLRSKKESSMRKALEYVKQNPNIGFVSAGNTGAVTALSTILLGTLENIKRPAFCSMIPTSFGACIMLDLGANKESNENHLLQFSIMGHAFAKINNISEPKVAILNIGTEEGKGKGYLQAASDLITKSFLKNNFIGFIEPDQITSGKADVIVTDGFTGNIALKTAEGLSRFIMGNFKHIFSQNIINNLAYLIIKKDLKKFSSIVNPTKYNGAMVIGLNGVVVKSHGNTDSAGFAQALNNCFNFLKSDVNNLIINELKMVNFIND
ncbi:MAG: Phosphate acyltransferase [Alphaproteobacteria bacterium MarineAlpha5_Bin11]|nr:phosphate acyltransferase [Pelagibacteraceae bacterium]PPR44079.1 MAG: Phosphate acyltransferase [Alphaproteobacteria bacterium MarineAlpha5_Bin11]|tara:strand:- start:3180 stop:4202 length:1023 start_codon:yes stop_codon:yes gene_type:complete